MFNLENPMKSRFFVLVVFVLGFSLVAQVLAQTNPNTLVNQRKGAMYLHGKYYGPLLAMVRERAPYDPATIQRNAEYLAVISQLPWDDFQPTTVGLPNTKAKEDVYKETAKFKAGIDTFQSEIQKLNAAARSGDRAAVGVAVRSVGRACNSCHEGFSTIEWRLPVQ
jgi:cytochrome c556